ncbi:hypothetical protein TNIN_172021 [Trichonephila inaurata madagascariensis]|uniref:Uncharacterized protein n=1 Tax=Trichonephila inaurata madagascariensis TaxID=2747483 RepID=A0A8X6X213_9ARAC|nr:hypothetical protein TNIN_172021 [Trichonephila inaurata madagascariensis]
MQNLSPGCKLTHFATACSPLPNGKREKKKITLCFIEGIPKIKLENCALRGSRITLRERNIREGRVRVKKKVKETPSNCLKNPILGKKNKKDIGRDYFTNSRKEELTALPQLFLRRKDGVGVSKLP